MQETTVRRIEAPNEFGASEEKNKQTNKSANELGDVEKRPKPLVSFPERRWPLENWWPEWSWLNQFDTRFCSLSLSLKSERKDAKSLNKGRTGPMMVRPSCCIRLVALASKLDEGEWIERWTVGLGVGRFGSGYLRSFCPAFEGMVDLQWR